MHNLLTLLRDYPDGPPLPRALRAACNDASDEVRVRAAMALGAEGQGTLLDVATCGYAEDGPMARAVAASGIASPGRTSTPSEPRPSDAALEAGRACLPRWAARGSEGQRTLAECSAVEKRRSGGGPRRMPWPNRARTAAWSRFSPRSPATAPPSMAAAAEALGPIGTAAPSFP
jgi:hypothetical protein